MQGTIGVEDSGRLSTAPRVCKLAHNRAVTAERLVVMLKDSWWDIPEGERVLGHRREKVLSRVITLRINEYFESKDGDGDHKSAKG